jgi:hypothetical protein
MYEMYPETWTDSHQNRASHAAGRPRRRARKEHSVVPAVIAHQQQAVKHEASEQH